MTDINAKARRAEINFAAIESTYWVSFCTISGFIAVYLGHRGLTDTQIGLTTSFGSTMAIVLQLILSNVLDKHPELAIKKLISALFLVGIAAIACLNFLPLPTAMMIMAYSTCYAMGLSNNGFLNAQLVQFNNAGIPAKYGWPRGVGSFAYAVSAYVYGLLIKAYSPDILMPCYLAGTAVCIVCVLLMPNPRAGMDLTALRAQQHHTSYREMLSGNGTLIVLLACTLLNNVGNMAGYTFTLRVVERVGGNTVEYGVSEFIRAAAEVPALFASGLLLRRFTVKSMLSFSFLFYGLRLLLMAAAPNIGMIYLASAVNMLCVGLSTFSSVMLVNSIVRDTEKVRGQSLYILCNSVGSIIGSAYAGFMIDHVGLTTMLLLSCLFCGLAFLGMIFLCKPENNTTLN